jgi:hypothetical protein
MQWPCFSPNGRGPKNYEVEKGDGKETKGKMERKGEEVAEKNRVERSEWREGKVEMREIQYNRKRGGGIRK